MEMSHGKETAKLAFFWGVFFGYKSYSRASGIYDNYNGWRVRHLGAEGNYHPVSPSN